MCVMNREMLTSSLVLQLAGSMLLFVAVATVNALIVLDAARPKKKREKKKPLVQKSALWRHPCSSFLCTFTPSFLPPFLPLSLPLSLGFGPVGLGCETHRLPASVKPRNRDVLSGENKTKQKKNGISR